jgi:phosphoenolpyruvate carboxykinase (ATP)
LNLAYRNLAPADLVERILARGEGRLSSSGAIAVETGRYTGRSPKDKYVVRNAASEREVEWGEVNHPVEPEVFERLLARALEHLSGRELYELEAFGGADPAHRIKLRLIAEQPYHALFAHQLFVRPAAGAFEADREDPVWTILSAPTFEAVPERDGTRSEVFVGLDLSRRIVLIVGTRYAGEIKKSVFTILNYLLPLEGILPMHCSANLGQRDDVALFFGLSGTGKTTLSADPRRRLIGDDEHGWSDAGVFNFEGGCYAKCIHLSAEGEPQIYEAIRFGTVLENVVLDAATRAPLFGDGSLTENTRAAYPIDYIPGAHLEGTAGHPHHILFLTCDAFGVLPPLAKLEPEQAMYHFLSGYTAKVAGTERGMGSAPEAVFSTCFGAPFLPLPAHRYAALLGERMRKHRTEAWLVNTGWTGGPHGVGRRMSLAHTRALIEAVTEGDLRQVPFERDPVFGLAIPRACPGVPAKVLHPRDQWKDGSEYDRSAAELAGRFRANFRKFAGVDAAVAAAGPAGG